MTSRQVYLHIVLPGATAPVPCGAFQRTEVSSQTWVGTFVYGRHYLARPDAVSIDPLHLPLAERVFETTRREGFPGAVRDSMPDFWGRVVIDRDRSGPFTDEIEYLLAAGEDRVGALIATPSRESPHLAPPPVVSLDRLLEAAQRIADDLPTSSESEQSTRSRAAAHQLAQDAAGILLRSSQLGGARPKALLADQGRLWLAKFPKRQDRWNDPLVEGAMLTLAARAGIAVPAHRIVTVGTQTALLVERFDRRTTAAGEVTRARYLSALTLLDSDDHATSVHEWSYPQLADQLALVSDTPDACRRALFRRMVFNACISNDDDHPRNHAVIAHDAVFHLSPAYDLTPSPQHGSDRRLAMATGIDAAGSVTRAANAAAMLRIAPRFGRLRNEEAVAIITEVWAVVAQEWSTTIRNAGGTAHDVERVRSAMCPSTFWDDWPTDLPHP